MVDEIVLELDGLKVSGWLEAEVTRSLETLSGTFAVTMSEPNPEDPLSRVISMGDRVRVRVAGETVIDGHVDRVRAQIGPAEHTVTVSGRDLAGDLVDCSAVLGSGELLGVSVLDVVRALVHPYGLKVEADAPVGRRFERFRVETGETVADAIARACRARGLLPVSDGSGGLRLTRAEGARVADELRQGADILEASADYSDRERFSKVTIKGQTPAALQAFGISDQATASDPAIHRHRPLVRISELPGGREELAERARVEVAQRAAAGARVSVTVAGWRHSGGLWAPGARVFVRSSLLAVARELTVATVRFRQDPRRQVATLSLVRPESLDLEPVPEPPQTAEFWSRPDA